MKPLPEYQADPVGFVREVLGCEPWGKQIQVLEELRDYHRVTARSCHGIGKTFIAAGAALWRLYCFEPSVVITTAPGHRQVKDVLWKRIRKLHRDAKVALPGTVLETAIKISDDHFATGFATDDTDRFQGYHERNILIIVEEASGVSRPIFEAIDGCMTSAGAKLLLIGNPTDPTSYFADSHKRERWRKIAVSAFDSPNVGGISLPLGADRWRGVVRERQLHVSDDGALWPKIPLPELVTPWWVEEKGEEWGIDSPIYAARVLGDFPDAADDSLFPLSWIEQSVERHKNYRALAGEQGGASPILQVDEGPTELGVDVARYGGCETVVAVRRGALMTRLEAWMGQDLMSTCGRIAAIVREEANVSAIKVDAIGLGAGVVDRLRELRLGVPVHAVNVAERAWDPVRYVRRRDESYFALRDRMRRGDVLLFPDDRLEGQLAALHYSYASDGRLEVESKDDMRKRGVRSPDRADAVVLAFLSMQRGGVPYVSGGPGRPGVARIGQ